MERRLTYVFARAGAVLLLAGALVFTLVLAVRPAAAAGGPPPPDLDLTVSTQAELATAITQTNSTEGNLRITLASDITLTGTLPAINPTVDAILTIEGDGHTIDANDTGRIFTINAPGIVTIKAITLTNGASQILPTFPLNYGGAIYNQGSLNIQDSRITSSVGSFGGAIYTSGPLEVRRSTLSDNGAYQGGAIHCEGGDPVDFQVNIFESTLNGNITDSYLGQGGALYLYYCDTTIVNSTISGNNSDTDGGGIEVDSGELDIYDSTIVLNNAGRRYGGGIHSQYANVAVTRSIISMNTVQGLNAFENACCGVGTEVYAWTNSGSAFNIWDSVTGFRYQSGLTGSIGQTNVLVPGMTTSGQDGEIFGPLQDNGGPTFTHALIDNSGLLDGFTGNPLVDAIDIASNLDCQNQPTGGIDQRGYARGVNGRSGPATSHMCDAGATEYGSSEAAFLLIEKRFSPVDNTVKSEFAPLWMTDTSFKLGDDQSRQFALPPGGWTLSEIAPTGWSDSVISCTDGGTSMTVNLSAGEFTKCTFTSTKVGALTVKKTVNGVMDEYEWQFDFNSSVGGFTLNTAVPSFAHEPIPVTTTIAITETAPPGYTTSIACDNAAANTSSSNSIAVEMGAGEIATCTVTNTAEPATLTVTLQTEGNVPLDYYGFDGDLGSFQLSMEVPSSQTKTFASLEAGPYALMSTSSFPDVVYSWSCTNGDSSPTGDLDIVLDPADAVECTVLAAKDPSKVFVAAGGGKTATNLAYQKRDVLMWDAGLWSKEFSGKDASLASTTDINAFDVDGGSLFLAFLAGQNVPGVGSTPPHDIVRYAHGGFTRVFDGSDVGLTLSSEKIDALTVVNPTYLPGSPSCAQAFLISTAGDTRVPGISYLVRGGDVLSFCASSTGSTTAGTWAMFIRASGEGMPATSTVGLSANPDLSTIYILSKGTFNVDSASGGASSIYKFDVATRTFSGPVWKASTNGLGQVVDSLDVEGDLP